MIHKTIYAIAFAVLLIVAGCSQKGLQETRPKETGIAVKTEQVNEVSVNDQISVSGNVEGNATLPAP